MSHAYNKIFTRIGVPYQRVEGDNGNIGGTSSHEFHYPAGIGKEGDNGILVEHPLMNSIILLE